MEKLFKYLTALIFSVICFRIGEILTLARASDFCQAIHAKKEKHAKRDFLPRLCVKIYLTDKECISDIVLVVTRSQGTQEAWSLMRVC